MLKRELDERVAGMTQLSLGVAMVVALDIRAQLSSGDNKEALFILGIVLKMGRV